MHERGNDLTVFHWHRPPCGQGTCERYRAGIDEAFCYITTTGRRTGRPHTIEIWFAGQGTGTIYVLAGGREQADWVRNLLADPHASVRIGEREGDATARIVVAGTEEDALARRLLVAKYQVEGATDLESWGGAALPVALEIDL